MTKRLKKYDDKANASSRSGTSSSLPTPDKSRSKEVGSDSEEQGDVHSRFLAKEIQAHGNREREQQETTNEDTKEVKRQVTMTEKAAEEDNQKYQVAAERSES